MLTAYTATIITAKASFIVSIVFFFFSIIQLINKKKPLSNYFLSIIYTAVGVQCLSFWFYCNDSSLFDKYFNYSDTAFLFLIGAFLYLFFLYITSDSKITLKKILINTAPFFSSLFFIEGVFPSLDIKIGLLIIEMITSLSYLSLFIYLILIYRTLHSYYIDKDKSPEIRFLRYIILCSIIFSFFLLLSNILWPVLHLISQIAFLCIPLLFIFFLIRYPRYLRKAQQESQEIRYRNSQIGSLDKDKVITQLDSLMDEKRIYKENNLSVKTLSAKLKISSPQLSELLNSHYKTNFNNFINIRRVEEIKTILHEKADENLLKIALDCGFNSKTTFNASFRKFTGMTPSDYKKQFFYKKRADL